MSGEFSPIWYVIFLPLAGFLIQAFLGKWIIGRLGVAAGRRVMGTLAVLPVAGAFCIGAWMTYRLAQVHEAPAPLALFDWIKFAGLSVPFEVQVDHLSMLMVLVVTGVGALIHLYATGYMSEERDYSRFFTYMNLFVTFMLVLVLAGNLPVMFIGWEGVGLCSYLLIGFWYKDIANAKAGNKAFIVNRIGDVGITLGMFLLIAVLTSEAPKGATDRWLSFDTIYASWDVLQSHPATPWIAILLFIGACGKSAQFPLYFWLPDAMAGPTPVSALIHAATMVTAGVFMVNRMQVVFYASPVASAVMACVGAFTALFAALIAFGQTDIKKVLAYSTVSQLGFMFIACGSGAYWAGMFHVTTHAFFKALLFLGAGAVIHGMMHNQDMRNYGNLRKYLPITFWTMMAAYLSISGFPYLAGFFSKEAILGGALGNELAVVDGRNLGEVAGWTGLVVAMLTAWYMTRMTAQTFFGKEERWRAIAATEHHEHAHEEHAEHTEHGPDVHGFFYTDAELESLKEPEEEHHELNASHTPHEAPPSMWIPLAILAVLSLVGGYWLEQVWKLHGWLHIDPRMQATLLKGEPEGIPLFWLSVVAASAGILIGAFIYWRGLPKKEGWDLTKWHPFRRWAGNQFGYDWLVCKLGVRGGDRVGIALWQRVDQNVIDGIVNGIGSVAAWFGRGIRVTQTGYVRAYALLMLIGGVGLLGYFVYRLVSIGGGL